MAGMAATVAAHHGQTGAVAAKAKGLLAEMAVAMAEPPTEQKALDGKVLVVAEKVEVKAPATVEAAKVLVTRAMGRVVKA